MKNIRLLAILFLTMGMVLLYVQPVLAFPPLPSSFNGTVKINGSNVPAGTVVSAWINGIQYKTTTVTYISPDMKYLLNVPGDDPTTLPIEGGVDGDTIVFYIGTAQAAQTGTWHSGTNVNLNLCSGLCTYRLYLPLVIR